MCEIANIKFSSNIWNAPIPLSLAQLQEIHDSDAGAIVFKTRTFYPKAGNPNDWNLFEDENGHVSSKNNIALHNDGIYRLLEDIESLRITKPIFISLYGNMSDMEAMIRLINNIALKDVLIEWNISCPNVEQNKSFSAEKLVKLQGISVHPIGIKVSHHQILLSEIDELLQGSAFVTAINTISGYGGKMIQHRALEAVEMLHKKIVERNLNVPIIGVGGIETYSDRIKFLNKGACALEVGTAFLQNGVKVFQMSQSQKVFINNLFAHSIIIKDEKESFTLKNGQKSDTYIDMRLLPSYPKLFNNLVELAIQRLSGLDFDIICGVPIGALPFASVLANRMNKPLIICRESIKNHGRNRQIEGEYKAGDKCLLIEDVITSGKSARNIQYILQDSGLIVENIFCIVNRGMDHDFLHLFHINELNHREIVQENSNPFAKRLRKIIAEKKTRLCFSADLVDPVQLLDVVEQVAPYICMVKIHSDILIGVPNSFDFYERLCLLARQYNFLIMEDRKLNDIGAIMLKQFESIQSRYYLLDSSDLCVTAFLNDMVGIEKLVQIANVVLIAQMSSTGLDPYYIEKVINFAGNTDITGLVAQERLVDGLLHFTPGVNVNQTCDDSGQQYRQPNRVDTDVIIVGRGIYNSLDPVAKAKEYLSL